MILSHVVMMVYVQCREAHFLVSVPRITKEARVKVSYDFKYLLLLTN